MLTHDRRITLLTLAAGLPAVALALALLWTGTYATLLRVTLRARGVRGSASPERARRVGRPRDGVESWARCEKATSRVAAGSVALTRSATSCSSQRGETCAFSVLEPGGHGDAAVRHCRDDGDLRVPGTERLVLVNGRRAVLAADAAELVVSQRCPGSRALRHRDNQGPEISGGSGRWENAAPDVLQGALRTAQAYPTGQPCASGARGVGDHRVIGHELKHYAPIK